MIVDCELEEFADTEKELISFLTICKEEGINDVDAVELSMLAHPVTKFRTPKWRSSEH